MFLRFLFLGIVGLSFGLLASAGVFTVLVSVGLIPRFAGKTHTSKKVFLFEEMVVLGTISGGIISVFEPYVIVGKWISDSGFFSVGVLNGVGNLLLACYGLFAGMFVGCLALAIAEMLDSIPIFTRRIGFRHGLGIVILSVALGKMCGSLFYFIENVHKP